MDHRPLLVRGDAAEDCCGLELVGEFVLVVGDLASVDPGIGPVDASPTGDLGDRGGIVAGDHLQLDTLLLEERKDLRGVGSHGVLEEHEAHRCTARRQFVIIPALVSAGDEQDAETGRCGVSGSSLLLDVAFVEEDVGRAEIEGAAIAELGCRPLPGRREREVAGDLPPLGCRVVGNDRLQGGVGRRVRCPERPEHLRSVSVGRVADRFDR